MAARSLPQEFQSNHPNSTIEAFEISFHTEDVEGVYQKAIKTGATDIAPPHLKPWGQKGANIRDPSGILIEITEYPNSNS